MEDLFELILQDEEDGIFANSLVAAGAIERDFVYFSNEVLFAEVSDEKRLVAGPMLIPNKKILRLTEDGERYYVYFSEQTIENVARKFMKNGFGGEVTLEHGQKTYGVYLTELWLVEQPLKDKSNLYGFTLPKGTLFAVYKVENDAVWEKVKDGTFNGYSIEGLFEHRKSDIKLSLEKEINELTDEEAELFLGQIKAIIKKDKRYGKGQRIEMESYSDYPDGVKGNARAALKYANDNGWGSCGTPVGKQRANQLAKGEPISVDTIKRMYSFLSRHEGDLETSKSFTDGCGYLMYMAWGGKSGLGWSRNKLRELGLLTESEAQPSITSTYPGEVAKKKKDDK